MSIDGRLALLLLAGALVAALPALATDDGRRRGLPTSPTLDCAKGNNKTTCRECGATGDALFCCRHRCSVVNKPEAPAARSGGFQRALPKASNSLKRR